MALFYISVFFGSVLLSAILTRVVRDIAVRRRLVDPANLGRHLHVRSVPRIGGIALFLGFTAAAVIGVAASRHAGRQGAISAHMLLSILLPALLVLLLGLCDDLISLGPYWKLGIETLAAIWLYIGGLGIHFVGSYFVGSKLRIPIGLFATIFWVLLITNAFNLIDGLDGLACGSAFIAAIVVCLTSLWGHAPFTSLLATALAGAALGFLRYNFHPATIFLGDSGSLLLGFLLSGLSFAVGSNAGVSVAVAVPIVCPVSYTHLDVYKRQPFGFFDFIRLERSAFCVLSDSGTVQEEVCIMGVPNVTIRGVTERPETIECGSNVLAGTDAQTIVNMVSMVTQNTRRWQPPAEYLAPHVADTVAGIVLGYRTAAEAATAPLANAAPMGALR